MIAVTSRCHGPSPWPDRTAPHERGCGVDDAALAAPLRAGLVGLVDLNHLYLRGPQMRATLRRSRCAPPRPAATLQTDAQASNC